MFSTIVPVCAKVFWCFTLDSFCFRYPTSVRDQHLSYIYVPGEDSYHIQILPAIASVSPHSGSIGGGQILTIKGTTLSLGFILQYRTYRAIESDLHMRSLNLVIHMIGLFFACPLYKVHYCWTPENSACFLGSCAALGNYHCIDLLVYMLDIYMYLCFSA